MEPRISIITLGVKDMARAIRFYRDGLGFPTDAKDDAQIAFFATAGTRLAIYPIAALAADIAPEFHAAPAGFGGITLAHNVPRKEEVAEVLKLAQAAGGKIVKEGLRMYSGAGTVDTSQTWTDISGRSPGVHGERSTRRER